jgi:hypothetical protein
MTRLWASGRRCIALGLLAFAPAVAASAQPNPGASAARRARTTVARPDPSLTMVHDGGGLVTVVSEEASLREVLLLLSNWFRFPIANAERIPETRTAMRFERMPVAQVVDRLLTTAGLNYVLVSHPDTMVPVRVVAGPRLAATGVPPPSNAPVYQVAPPGYGSPMSMPTPTPIDVDPQMAPLHGAMPVPLPVEGPYPMMPPAGAPSAMPSLANPQSATSPFRPQGAMPSLAPPGAMPPVTPQGPAPAPVTPSASRPGVVVPSPASPVPPPGTKPPGAPDQ